MSTTLRDRAKGLRERKPPIEEETPASAEEEAPIEDDDDEATDTQAHDEVEAEDTDTDEDDSNVVDFVEKAIERLSDDDVEAYLDSKAPGLAHLEFTRRTKADQLQYDGKTSDGYIVRVWAPLGSNPITEAQLSFD